jgi:parallel beta helix pectate lyase-like protein
MLTRLLVIACFASWPRAARAASAPATATYELEYFVATTGSDSNPGTVSAPFATLERAQRAVRGARAAGLPRNGLVVTIRSGTYRRTTPLLFSEADSGTPTGPVVWRAYPGETVRITGGRTVDGWALATSGNTPAGTWARIKTTGVYKANIGLAGHALIANFVGLTSPPATAAGDPDMRGVGISSSAVPFRGDQGLGNWLPHPRIAELIYDGQMMKLARWPKRSDDPAVATSWLKAGPGGSATQFTSGTTITGRGWAPMSGIPDVDKPWAHVVGGGYHDAVVQMTAASGTSITTATADPEGIDGRHHQGRWAALNLLEELTEIGEYWIDRTNGVVYFKPGADPTGHETVVSELPGPLVEADTTARYIVFDGLVFEATQSFLMRIAGERITVKNATFRNAGGSGILIGNGFATVERSKFYDLVGSGVVLVGMDVRHMLATGSHHAAIANSEFYRVGRYAHGRVPAIMMGGGGGHVIAHNHIHDVPNMGIYMLSSGATIEYNVFQRTGLHGCDHGAVYAWNNRNANTIIRYNIFREIRMNATYPGTRNEGYIVAGIYCDDRSTGYTTHSNIFFEFMKSDACPTCNATPAIVNKTTGNSFRNSVFSNVWQIYYGEAAGAGGGPYMSNNQAWEVRYGFPSGAVSSAIANPTFANPADGDFSNQPDGTMLLVNGTDPIPVMDIGSGIRSRR